MYNYYGNRTDTGLCEPRTFARKFVRVGFTFVQGGLTFKFDKNSTNLKAFIFQFGGLGALFGGLSPPKPSRGDGTV